ncbi:MAG TPA: phosphosulfolactate synthase [Baekduia sp.]|nr:phosphosulfolactate synthase [Baekduia sp.]
MIFEAPQRVQQVWFLKRFGLEVNLGNIAPGDVLSLETLRLGLRSDTMETDA